MGPTLEFVDSAPADSRSDFVDEGFDSKGRRLEVVGSKRCSNERFKPYEKFLVFGGDDGGVGPTVASLGAPVDTDSA